MNFWKTSTLVLSATLGAIVAYGTISPAQADAQPKMQAALSALEVAKTKLDNASTDKGGFRVKALQATKDAIEATKKGIAYDNANEGKGN